MTNFEKIKAMTIDEMAEAIASKLDHCFLDQKCTTTHCKDCIRNWLESETET